VAEPRPYGKGVFYLRPFVPEGFTPSGIFIQHHRSLPAIFGRVTAVHASCRSVRVGDWVVFEAGRPVRLKWRGGHVYALRERALLGIVLPPDGLPWFSPPSKEERAVAVNGVLVGATE
jgi:hypothetical protein